MTCFSFFFSLVSHVRSSTHATSLDFLVTVVVVVVVVAVIVVVVVVDVVIVVVISVVVSICGVIFLTMS